MRKQEEKKRESRLWIEDYSCACCDFFWPGWVDQQVELNHDNADALYRDLRDVMKNGFARYAYPLLSRLIELEPDSRRVDRICRLRIEQLNAIRNSSTETVPNN